MPPSGNREERRGESEKKISRGKEAIVTLLLVFSQRVHILFGMCRYDYVSLLLVVHPFHSRMFVL